MTRKFTWPELPDALHECQPWGRPGIEPPLSEVLADPIINAVMRRDGVSSAALEAVVAHAQRRLRQSRALGSPPRHRPRKECLWKTIRSMEVENELCLELDPPGASPAKIAQPTPVERAGSHAGKSDVPLAFHDTELATCA